MGWTRLAVASVLALVGACGPVDGQIFVEQTTGVMQTSTDDADAGPADAESSDGSMEVPPTRCASAGTLSFAGNDPRFEHDCGESCDSDWCGCDPCRAVAGPLGRLREGSHRLYIEAGVSSSVDYRVTVRLESGEILVEREMSRDGLFTEELDFVVEPGCPLVEFEWVQHTVGCSRVYDLWVEPQ